MKFYHIADVHLGAVPDRGRPYSEQRRQDIWDTFRDMIHLAVREQPDCLFVCGDLFHRQPLKRELKEVDYLFSLIPDTRVFLMAGNHDFAGEGSAYRRFSWSPNVFFFSQEKLSAVSLELSQETARRSGIRHLTVYGHSYQKREYREALYDRVCPLEKEGVHVLMAHGGDASHIPMDYGKIASGGFDYVAMGHIHRPAIWRGGKLMPVGVDGVSASTSMTGNRTMPPGTRAESAAGMAGDRMMKAGVRAENVTEMSGNLTMRSEGYSELGISENLRHTTGAAFVDSCMAYAGAPEPLEVNDVGMHGFIRGEIFIDPRTGDHRTRVEFVPVARRTYVSVEIPVTASTTGLELEDRVRHLTGGKATISQQDQERLLSVDPIHAEQHAGGYVGQKSDSQRYRGMDREVQVASGYLYRIVLTGERDPQWEPNVDRLLALENVADVTDHTRPAWDWEALSRQYQGQLIGRFLAEYEGRELSPAEQLSRTYGLEALLTARGGEI